MVKVIFINASTREIKEVNLEGSVLKETYKLIGNDCSLVQTGAYFTGNDALMVDEEGYFKEGLDGFCIRDKGVFYGNAVIWGCDEEGESADCETSIQDIESNIIWIEKDLIAPVRETILNTPSQIFVKF